jgi:protein SCO1/2
MTSRRTNMTRTQRSIGMVASATMLALTLGVAPLRAATDEELSPMLMSPDAVAIKEVQFHQRLDNQVDVNAKFTNSDGEETTIAECMDGKPTVFVLAYYRCPRLCNMVLNGVAKVLQAIDFEPGKDFNVVVVSFDATDTIEIAADNKNSVVHAFNRNGDPAGWNFLIGDQETVKAAAESVGFQYVYDKKSGEYAHASGIVLLTPEGRVSRYFYGIDYPTRDVRLGLVEASQGQIGSPVDELLLLCLHYDPTNGKYGLAILNLVRAGGLLTIVAMVGFIGHSIRKDRLPPLPSGERPGEGLEPADTTSQAQDNK